MARSFNKLSSIDAPELSEPSSVSFLKRGKLPWKVRIRTLSEASVYFRPMSGGSQSHLLLAGNGFYVVKFSGNPQHKRVLANEWFATHLAKELRLPVPNVAAIRIKAGFLESTPFLQNETGSDTALYTPGIHFGSRFVGGVMPGKTSDYLPTRLLRKVENIGAFCGALLFDKWTCNADIRQCVFLARSNKKQHKVFFIDHGFCFNSSKWRLHDPPKSGCYPYWEVYSGVRGPCDFEPWLERLEQLNVDAIWRAALSIPEEWYDGNRSELEALVDQLEERRSGVWTSILKLRAVYPSMFPRWV